MVVVPQSITYPCPVQAGVKGLPRAQCFASEAGCGVAFMHVLWRTKCRGWQPLLQLPRSTPNTSFQQGRLVVETAPQQAPWPTKNASPADFQKSTTYTCICSLNQENLDILRFEDILKSFMWLWEGRFLGEYNATVGWPLLCSVIFHTCFPSPFPPSLQ